MLAEIPQQPMLIAAGVALLGSAYAIWKLVGAAIKLMIFLASFVVGFGVAYALGQFGGHPQALWVYAGEGIGFAWVVSLIRAKIARTVAGLAVLGLGHLTGWFGFAPKSAEPSADAPAHAAKHTPVKHKHTDD